MTSDNSRKGTLPDVPYLPAGSGSVIGRRCSKCDQTRDPRGGRGISPRWRCAVCEAVRLSA